MRVIYGNEQEYQDEKEFCNRLRLILDKCEKFEGKQISQRIVTHLKKELPEYHFWMVASKLMVCLGSKTHTVHFPHNGIWNRENIWKESACGYGFYAEQRIKQYERYQSSSVRVEVEEIEQKIVAMREELKKLENDQRVILETFLAENP